LDFYQTKELDGSEKKGFTNILPADIWVFQMIQPAFSQFQRGISEILPSHPLIPAIYDNLMGPKIFQIYMGLFQ
jgi:hypothetical protein